MSLLYDPQKKQTKPWVFVAFIIIPIAMLIVGLLFGKKYSSQKQHEKNATEVDIFDKY